MARKKREPDPIYRYVLFPPKAEAILIVMNLIAFSLMIGVIIGAWMGWI